MYHIVICDDEPIFLTQISEMIIDILASMGESCEIIVIGKPLISSQAFPPLHTVHATFTAHGVPSVSRFRCLNNQTCHRNTVLC